MPTNSKTTNTTKTSPTPFWKFVFSVATILAAVFILAGTLVCLIGVSHTTIFLIATAWTPLFLFFIPTATLSLATGVIFLKQPVHSLLCLIAVFFTTVLLYIYAGAEFLAFLFLIVYVGAIAILFLFVIMLLHLKELVTLAVVMSAGTVFVLMPSSVVTFIGIDDLLSYAISAFFVLSNKLAFSTEALSADALVWFVNNRFADILTFSLLYTYYCILFFIASLLLLTAMLGAIILATSATDTPLVSSGITYPAPKQNGYTLWGFRRVVALSIIIAGMYSMYQYYLWFISVPECRCPEAFLDNFTCVCFSSGWDIVLPEEKTFVDYFLIVLDTFVVFVFYVRRTRPRVNNLFWFETPEQLAKRLKKLLKAAEEERLWEESRKRKAEEDRRQQQIFDAVHGW